MQRRDFHRLSVAAIFAGLLARESGWLIFNTHGLDDEGWGPVRAVYLEKLLDRLGGVESVAVLPAGRALAGSE